MTVTSKSHGHEIVWNDSQWVWADTGEVADVRPCKRCGKQPVSVYVKIPADLSCTEQEKWRFAQIDACVAPIVAALQAAGIDMRGSCCGHGERPGEIVLQDGRKLQIHRKED